MVTTGRTNACGVEAWPGSRSSPALRRRALMRLEDSKPLGGREAARCVIIYLVS